MGIEIWNDNAVWYPTRRNWGNVPILNWAIIPVLQKINSVLYGRVVDIDYVKITE